tara:strand:- start:580 stop:822 length:243 start_codon:yes stop_codon:yes gene_type:complete
MISKRCRGLNLLNHIKQKYDYEISYEFINDNNSPHHSQWLVKFQFNNKMYEVISSSKNSGIEKILDDSIEDIYKVIRVKQ